MLKLSREKILLIVHILVLVLVANIQLSFRLGPDMTFRQSTLYEIYNAINPMVFDDFTTPIDNPEGLTNGEIYGFVYFGRDNCEDCVMFNAILKEYLEEHPCVVYKYDTSKFRGTLSFSEILEKYGIDSVPTLVLIDKEGNLAKKLEIEGRTWRDIQNGMTDFFNEE